MGVCDPSEAIEAYGSISYIKVGSRGGFKEVRYGTTVFTNRAMDPRGKVEIPREAWANGVVRWSSTYRERSGSGTTMRLAQEG